MDDLQLKGRNMSPLACNWVRKHANQKSTWARSAARNIGAALVALAVGLCATGAAADVVFREVDGGPQYYGQFSNPLPSGPNYFPIGVWFEGVTTQSEIDMDKDAGLNLYVVLTRNSNLQLVRGNGMHAILQQSEWRNISVAATNSAVTSWELADEIDMTEGPGAGYITLNKILARLPADGRLRFNNYGKGVMFWATDVQAAHFVNQFQQVASNDIYWFTDPHVHGPSEGGRLLNGGNPLSYKQTRRAANYGYTVDRMRALDARDGRRQPIWNFVEVGWPFTETAADGARAIQPAEVKAAVWHSIIAGARGIIYFNHSFGGANQTQHALRDPAYAHIRAAVKSTNRLIKYLAPVLNAPFAQNFVRINGPVRAMAKCHNNKFYIFAGSKENAASMATFQLSKVNSGTAFVVGEGRRIPISRGFFRDRFADGNAIHIYRIDAE